MKGTEPVASSRRSYSASVPSAATTLRRTRSIRVASLPRCRVMPLSAYQDSGLSTMSSKSCSPASTGDSRMRL